MGIPVPVDDLPGSLVPDNDLPSAAPAGYDASGFQTTFRPFGIDTGLQMPGWLSRGLAGAGGELGNIPTAIQQRILDAAGLFEDTDLVNAAKQKLQAEVEAKRGLDQPLMDTTAGKVGSVVGQAAPFIAASVLMPGAPTILGQMGTGMRMGAAQGFLTPTTGDESALVNTAIGAGVGGATGAGAQLIGNVLRPTAGVQNKSLIDAAKKHGITVRIGDQVESPNLKNIEDVMRFLPGTAGKELALDQANIQILNKTLAKNMGIPEAALQKTNYQITKELVDKAATNLNRTFQHLSSGKMFKTTGQEFTDSLAAAKQKFALLEPEIRDALPEVDRWFKIADRWQKRGWIDGDQYQVNRSMLATKVRDLYRAPGHSAEAKVLDDVLEAVDSITPNTPAWNEARRKWAVYKMVEKNPNLITKEGNVAPKQLNRSLATGNKAAFAKGRQGDLGEMADVATAYLKDPNSATAMRSYWQQMLTNPLFLSGAGGAVGGLSSGEWDWGKAAGGAALGFGTPMATQALLRSRIGQAYLRNGIPLLRDLVGPATATVPNLAVAGALGE